MYRGAPVWRGSNLGSIAIVTARQDGLLRGRLLATDRVGVTGLRPLPLPHHRTCGFHASGGWSRWWSHRHHKIHWCKQAPATQLCVR